MRVLGWGLLWGGLLSGVSLGAPSFRSLSNIPQELTKPASSLGGLVTGKWEKTLQFSDLVFKDISKKQIQVQLQGSQVFFREGMPQVPVRSESLVLPPGKKAVVSLEGLEVDESQAALSLPVTPKAQSWEPNHRLVFATPQSGRYFPGKWYAAKQLGGVLHISWFPVQWDQQTGRILALRKANVKVEWGDGMQEVVMPDRQTTPAIILTSESLLPAALQLKRFHAEVLSVPSSIVTVESIVRTEPLAELSSYPRGYADTNLANLVSPFDPKNHSGYDFETARKIKSYFDRKRRESRQFQYLTILGDVEEVPPSYYFALDNGFSEQVGVTDLCYGAIDRCFEAQVAVGRLPFSSLAEVENYLSKVNRWLKFASQAPSELALFGGRAFPSDVYIGELGTLKTLNSDRTDWKGVQKFHRTRKNYTKANVLEMARGNHESAFLYYLDHGHGNQWYVEKNYVSSKEILEAKDAGQGVNPFVVSIACINAAFDEEISKDDVLANAQDGEESVGVSLLKSKAGAIAYLGSARFALGMPVYHFDKNGNLNLTGTTYGLQMLDTFFDKYRTERAGRLGDILLKMYRAYATENGNDFSSDSHVWTYFNVALLGDPALRLPTRGDGEKVYPRAQSTTNFSKMVSDLPQLILNGENAFEFSFTALSRLKATLLKLPETSFGVEEQIVQSEWVNGSGKFVANFESLQSQGSYFLRLENAEGVPLERQIWFSVTNP